GTQVSGPTGFRLMLDAYGNRSVPLWPSALLAIAPPANETIRITANTQAAATDQRSRRSRLSHSLHWLLLAAATGRPAVPAVASAAPPISLRLLEAEADVREVPG